MISRHIPPYLTLSPISQTSYNEENTRPTEAAHGTVVQINLAGPLGDFVVYQVAPISGEGGGWNQQRDQEASQHNPTHQPGKQPFHHDTPLNYGKGGDISHRNPNATERRSQLHNIQ